MNHSGTASVKGQDLQPSQEKASNKHKHKTRKKKSDNEVTKTKEAIEPIESTQPSQKVTAILS